MHSNDDGRARVWRSWYGGRGSIGWGHFMSEGSAYKIMWVILQGDISIGYCPLGFEGCVSV